MGMPLRTLLFLGVLPCASCAGLRLAPLGEHAQIVLVGMQTPADTAQVNYLRVYRDVRCDGARSRGLSIGPEDAGDKSLEVEGAQRVFLFGTAERWATRGITGEPGVFDLVGNRCEFLVSFITEPSHTYRVSEDAGESGCRISVLDEQTSIAPPDLAVHDSTLCNELGRKRESPPRPQARRQDVPPAVTDHLPSLARAAPDGARGRPSRRARAGAIRAIAMVAATRAPR